jgi:hypothetical protein
MRDAWYDAWYGTPHSGGRSPLLGSWCRRLWSRRGTWFEPCERGGACGGEAVDIAGQGGPRRRGGVWRAHRRGSRLRRFSNGGGTWRASFDQKGVNRGPAPWGPLRCWRPVSAEQPRSLRIRRIGVTGELLATRLPGGMRTRAGPTRAGWVGNAVESRRAVRLSAPG